MNEPKSGSRVVDNFWGGVKVVEHTESQRKARLAREREEYDWEIRNDMEREARLDRDGR